MTSDDPWFPETTDSDRSGIQVVPLVPVTQMGLLVCHGCL